MNDITIVFKDDSARLRPVYYVPSLAMYYAAKAMELLAQLQQGWSRRTRRHSADGRTVWRKDQD